MLLGVAGWLWVTKAAAGGFVIYQANPQRVHLQLVWKDATGRPLRSLQRLTEWAAARHQTLVFGMNAGMYAPSHAPQGLYIEDFKQLAPLDTAQGQGNFYLQPNGVFYLTAANTAGICTSRQFRRAAVRFATQSGPLLVQQGRMHPAFRPGSTNLNVRNGVGIRPDGTVVFAMSKEKINFYDFAAFFLRQGCRDALYLDGLVSRTYLPAAHWEQTDGDFGVMVAVTVP